ncbi:DICT sensory domain-containing protein [Nocardioides caldifontis]|uniref:DICT sensory domain-containing protein n=1 Tax=Nocardioides caldifontis TaxID=2588938 RepID=UPI0011E0393E|nr:DICT sensory domain-containing protein [Nocardioides caldifontis]
MQPEEVVIAARDRYPASALTISELAQRTGVPQATLRSWEARYGFPRPERLPGGHRRYAESDVAGVEEVLRHRAAGLGLEAAVRRAVAGPVGGNASLHGELRRRHPTLVPQLLSKRSMVALSHALEDECCAQAQRPLLFAGFQRRRFLRESYARWVELARTAGQAVVFADLEEPAPVQPGSLVEVAVPYDAAINREWFLVCDAPDRPACLVGWERPGQPLAPDSARRFETVWSVDPVVVREAARICVELADTYRPGWRVQEWQALDETPAPASADLHRATGLVNRMMGYLDTAR